MALSTDDKNLMIGAAHEITALRRKLEIADARLGMFDQLTNFLHAAVPLRGGGEAGVDIVATLRKRYEEG